MGSISGWRLNHVVKTATQTQYKSWPITQVLYIKTAGSRHTSNTNESGRQTQQDPLAAWTWTCHSEHEYTSPLHTNYRHKYVSTAIETDSVGFKSRLIIIIIITLCQSGKKDLLGVRRWQRRSFSVPESFGAGAALQRCIVVWHLASHWLHGLMICTHSCIILIFKLPREHIYQGFKKKK